MKRSKMIELIDDFCHKYYQDTNHSEELLDLVEKAGMLPPTIGYLNLKNSDIFKDVELDTIPINSWEESGLFSINPEEYEKWKKNE